METKLTPKQELFAQTYVKTGNASEAYRVAYNVKTKNEKTINPKASNLLNEYKINTRVRELQKQLQEKHDISKDKILTRLQQIIFNQEAIGVDKIDLTAMNKAIDTINKMLGYYKPEKHKIEHAGIVTMLPERDENL